VSPRLFLRLEGVAVAAAAIVLYVDGDHPWWLFVALILVPDLSMLGYLGGVRLGAATYNLAHTFVWPAVLLTIGVLADSETTVAIGLIWAAHVGVDRATGYGLKYRTGFKDTHLQRV
jgi:Domain of unknown function (DUF4260)